MQPYTYIQLRSNALHCAAHTAMIIGLIPLTHAVSVPNTLTKVTSFIQPFQCDNFEDKFMCEKSPMQDFLLYSTF